MHDIVASFRDSLKDDDIVKTSLLIHMMKQQGSINNYSPWDRELKTPLMHAAMAGKEEIVALLLTSGADVNVTDNDNYTALYYCTRDESFDRPTGNVNIMKQLIDAGIDINTIALDGTTALIYFCSLSSLSNTSPIHLLIESGADIDRQDSSGETPLMISVRGGKHNFIKLLLEAGADLSICSEDGDTALTLAKAHGYKTIVDILMQEDSL